MSYNVQYKHTDRSAIDRRIAGLQAELDDLTPNEDDVVSYPCPDTAKLNEKIADLQAQLDDITPTEGEVYSCTDTAILNAKLDNIQEQIDNIEPDPDDPDDPTPDPEPTGDTTAYQECCEISLNGEWNSETNTCFFEYDGTSMMYGTEDLDLVISCTNSGGTWDACSSTCSFDPTPDPEPTGDTTNYEEYCAGNLGGEWSAENNWCVVPVIDPNTNEQTEKYYSPSSIDQKIACESNGGTWDIFNVTCCDQECSCLQQGGTWDPVNNECTYPEPDPDPCEGYADPMECNCVNMGGSWIEDPENPGTYICDYPELP